MMRKWNGTLVILALALFTTGAARAQTQEKKPPTTPGAAKEALEIWNSIGKRLITMAEDWPEDKYDFKPNPAQRSFAEQLLHAAGTDRIFTAAIEGKPLDYGWENPPRDNLKTKAEIVAYVKQSVEDGAAAIQALDDQSILKTVKYPYGNMLATKYFCIADASEHMGEHYGQLVVYYRVNNVVPPASRPRK